MRPEIWLIESRQVKTIFDELLSVGQAEGALTKKWGSTKAIKTLTNIPCTNIFNNDDEKKLLWWKVRVTDDPKRIFGVMIESTEKPTDELGCWEFDDHEEYVKTWTKQTAARNKDACRDQCTSGNFAWAFLTGTSICYCSKTWTRLDMHKDDEVDDTREFSSDCNDEDEFWAMFAAHPLRYWPLKDFLVSAFTSESSLYRPCYRWEGEFPFDEKILLKCSKHANGDSVMISSWEQGICLYKVSVYLSDPGCFSRDDKGQSYEGPQYHTYVGRKCIDWAKVASNGEVSNRGMTCRNDLPEKRTEPWCHYKPDEDSWSYCGVPPCIPGPKDFEAEYGDWAEWSGCNDNKQVSTRTCKPAQFHGTACIPEKLQRTRNCPAIFSYVAGENCRKTEKGEDFKGVQSYTKSGKLCLSWNRALGFYPESKENLLKKLKKEDATYNYCRNPDNSKAPWCYTWDLDVLRDYCDIPDCQRWFVYSLLLYLGLAMLGLLLLCCGLYRYHKHMYGSSSSSSSMDSHLYRQWAGYYLSRRWLAASSSSDSAVSF